MIFFSGYQVITQYLDNEFVHKLDPKILKVINDRMSAIEDLSLTEEQQNALTKIVETRLTDADPQKIKLWNEVLGQVSSKKEGP